MNSSTINILFCGTGGQGVLTASEVCGWAAIFSGYHVKKSEVHGMAQRGGSVESHLRFGKKVFSPLIPKGQADYLVCFNKDEGRRLKAFLRPKGKSLENQLGNKSHLNTFLLGVLSKHLSLKEENWLRAFELVFKDKNLEENKKIFIQGSQSSTA